MAAAPLLALAAIAFGTLAAWLAARQQRNPAVWLVFGALLGPIAVALLIAAPPAVCPTCSERTVGFEQICSVCGFSLRRSPPVVTPVMGALAVPTESRVDEAGGGDGRAGRWLRSVPDAEAIAAAADQAQAASADTSRLSAVGSHRPAATSANTSGSAAGTDREVTILAIGVFVQGSEGLLAGARYLIARINDRLRVMGPVDAATKQVELDLPLAGVEANAIGDRLVISGRRSGRNGRAYTLAFQAVASMTRTPVDEALMEPAPPISIATGRP